MSHLLPTGELLGLVAEALAPAGEQAASLVARALVDAEVRGHHRFGLRLLDELPTGSREELALRLSIGEPEPPGTGASLTFDLAGKFAPAAVAALIGPACRRAAEQGVSLVRLRGIGKFGRLAPYVEAVAERGAIGVLTMSSPSFVAPYGGNRAVLGTNPFAVAVPTTQRPIVVDSASSAITAARWHNAQAGSAVVPEGSLVDDTGQPTTDPEQAVAIAPRGGQFGTVVGIAVEALTAAVTGQLSDPHGAPRGGHLLVIEPAEGAAAAGGELARRLTGAGGHVPGRPVDWPATLEVDPDRRRRLELLASLN